MLQIFRIFSFFLFFIFHFVPKIFAIFKICGNFRTIRWKFFAILQMRMFCRNSVRRWFQIPLLFRIFEKLKWKTFNEFLQKFSNFFKKPLKFSLLFRRCYSVWWPNYPLLDPTIEHQCWRTVGALGAEFQIGHWILKNHENFRTEKGSTSPPKNLLQNIRKRLTRRAESPVLERILRYGWCETSEKISLVLVEFFGLANFQKFVHHFTRFWQSSSYF